MSASDPLRTLAKWDSFAGMHPIIHLVWVVAALAATACPSRKPTGAKLALKPFHVWGIHVRLQVGERSRDLALFDLALDSKLRGCDLIQLKVSDLVSASGVKRRVMILQQKTGRPVQFEVTEQARRSIAAWIEAKLLGANDWFFPSRMKPGRHVTTRQYARLVDKWVGPVGLDPAAARTV